ncbi:head-tail adaptor protein [Clostridium tyrobutyricum]|nr:head-tail adaptor protein [Clostridium tyrobutyricum]
MQNTQAGTEYANVTHRLRCRKQSIKNLSTDMYFIDKDNLRYDIEYFQPNYKDDDFWEIMLQVQL